MAAAGTQASRSPARRGMYVLPSTFTAGNIAIGYYAIVQSIRGLLERIQVFHRDIVLVNLFTVLRGAEIHGPLLGVGVIDRHAEQQVVSRSGGAVGRRSLVVALTGSWPCRR